MAPLRAGAGAGLGGVLSGLGSGMVRGPYAASAKSGGAEPCPVNPADGPPGLARRGSQPREVGKAAEAPAPATMDPVCKGNRLLCRWRARPADAGAERGEDRSVGPADGRAARTASGSEPLELVLKVVTQWADGAG